MTSYGRIDVECCCGTKRIAKAIDGLTDAIIGPRMVFVIGPVKEQTDSAPRNHGAFRCAKKGKVLAMLQLTDSQMCSLSVSMKDKKGNPVADTHDLTWGVDNTDLLALAASADGRTCDISAVGPLGTALVSVQDADDAISGTLEVEIVSGAATEVVITAGTPSEQP